MANQDISIKVSLDKSQFDKGAKGVSDGLKNVRRESKRTERGIGDLGNKTENSSNRQVSSLRKVIEWYKRKRQAAIDAANGETNAAFRAAKSNSATLRQLGKIRRAYYLIAFGATAAFSTLAISRFATQIDRVAKNANRLGVSVRSLQAFQFAANISGVEVETLTKGVSKLQQALGQARQGLRSQVRAFNDLNLSVRELEALSPDEQFIQVAKAIGELGSQSQKVQIARDLFGRGGVELLTAFNGGLLEAVDEFGNLNVALTQFQAKSVEAFNDSKTKLGAVFGGLGQQFVANISPALTRIVGELTGLASTAGTVRLSALKMGMGFIRAAKFATDGLSLIEEGLLNVLKGVNSIRIRRLSEEIGELTSSISGSEGQFRGTIFADSAEDIEEMKKRLVEARSELNSLLTAEEANRGVTGRWGSLADDLTKEINRVAKEEERLRTALSKQTKANSNKVSKFQTIQDVTIGGNIGAEFKSLADRLREVQVKVEDDQFNASISDMSQEMQMSAKTIRQWQQDLIAMSRKQQEQEVTELRARANRADQFGGVEGLTRTVKDYDAQIKSATASLEGMQNASKGQKEQVSSYIEVLKKQREEAQATLTSLKAQGEQGAEEKEKPLGEQLKEAMAQGQIGWTNAIVSTNKEQNENFKSLLSQQKEEGLSILQTIGTLLTGAINITVDTVNGKVENVSTTGTLFNTTGVTNQTARQVAK